MLGFSLAEDNTVHLMELVVRPIFGDGLDFETGTDEFAYQDLLRHAVSNPVCGDALGNN